VECARVVVHLNEMRAADVAKNKEPAAAEGTPDQTPRGAEQGDAPPKALAGPLQLIKDRFFKLTGIELQTDALLENAAGYIGGTLLSSVQVLLNVALGLAMMVLALYYFLADGPAMIRTAMRMSPLDDTYEQELLDKFANVSRAVVVASLASAVVQGLLSGVGYYFALPAGAPIFLLTMLTMAFAIVPFVGAAAIWAPTAAWIYLAQGVGDAADSSGTTRAILLALYGACVVSMADNVIKPFVLHGQSNMHPLLALISVLGGVQVLGPIGILVGPMLVAFVQAVLTMLNKELKLMGDAGAATKKGDPDDVANIHPALKAEAEAAAAQNVGLLDQISAGAAAPIVPEGDACGASKVTRETEQTAGGRG